MFEFIVFLFVLFLIPAAWYSVQYGILQLAKLGVLWDIVPEGYARAYVKMGKLAKMGLSYTGFQFKGALPTNASQDTDNLGVYKIVHLPNEMALPNLDNRLRDILLPSWGVVWKGLPGFYETHTVNKLTWIDSTFQERVAENVTEVLVRAYVYGLKMDNVELQGSLEFNFRFLVGMQVTNPALVWFRIDRYVDAVLGGIKILIIKHFKGLSWTDVVGTNKASSQQGSTTQDALTKALKAVVKAAKEFEELYGVKIYEVGVFDFEAANAETRLAITSEEVSLLKANAQIAEAEGRAKITKIDADAKANAKRTEAQAEADAINTINSAAANMSENALLLKGFSAIENASASVTLVGKDLNLGGMILPSNRNQP
jgi:hypothetical protein